MKTGAVSSSTMTNPDTGAENQRLKIRVLGTHSSMMNLGELANGTRREHRRSESQVWRPRDALLNQRPHWASVGHHAIVPWRSPSRFDDESTIRVVRGPEMSEYDAENDSIWGPLDSDMIPLLQKDTLEDGDANEESSDAEERASRVPITQPAMPSRKPPLPPKAGFRQDSFTALADEHDSNHYSSSETKYRKSRFVEHVAENTELLQRLGIWEKEKRRWSWFSSLTRRS